MLNANPTKVVLLKNMFDPSGADETSDPRFFDELKEDVMEECGKYDSTKSVAGAKIDRNSAGHVYMAFSDADGAKNKVDPVSVVYQIIREHARANRLPAVNVSEILPKVLSRGRTKEDLERCMGEYEELDVWQVNADRTIIRFVT